MTNHPMPHDRQQPARGRDRQEPGRRPVASGSAAVLSPDCEQGKCAACTGGAWDFTVDAAVPCECRCH